MQGLYRASQNRWPALEEEMLWEEEGEDQEAEDEDLQTETMELQQLAAQVCCRSCF
jgi:hypothetical protein